MFLLHNFGLVRLDWDYLWPLFLVVPGLGFELGYFTNRHDPGLLVPGGILLTYGALFYVNILFGWGLMELLWPVFPLGVALGLFQLYWFGTRDRGLLIPVGILGGFSLLALLFTLNQSSVRLVLPLVLIGLGLYLLRGKRD